MHLIEILLPIKDNGSRAYPAAVLDAKLRQESIVTRAVVIELL